MSWHYLQGQEAACWHPGSSDGTPDALLSLMPSPDVSSSPDNATDTSTGSLSGTTSTPSTVGHGEGQLTLFQGASPAKTSAQRVRVKDSPVAVQDLFLRCFELLGRHNLRLSFRKTVRDCVPVALAPSSKNLPAWGLTFDGACWELGTSARLIEETECGSLLPTPTASHYGTRNNGKRGDGTTYKTAGSPSLQTMAKHGTWPTPTAQDAKNNAGPSQFRRNSAPLNVAVQSWPTQTAGDAKSSGRRLSNPNSTAHAGTSLTDAVNGGPTTQRTGKLNPSWVESYLMMWPLGWTVVQGSARLATDRFQRWLDWHGTYSGD